MRSTLASLFASSFLICEALFNWLSSEIAAHSLGLLVASLSRQWINIDEVLQIHFQGVVVALT